MASNKRHSTSPIKEIQIKVRTFLTNHKSYWQNVDNACTGAVLEQRRCYVLLVETGYGLIR